MAASVLAALPAWAANWEFEPRVAAGYRYNDNYRLGPPGTEIEVSGAELDARLRMGTVHPRTRFELTPRVRATYFPDEREVDSTDYFLYALLADETPRRRVGVRGELSRQDIVRSELPGVDFDTDLDPELGQPDIGDAGRVLQRNRRDLISLAPYWSYDLSQRHLLELEARYTDASYQGESTGLVDYSELTGSAGIGFMFSERSSVTLRGLLSRYDTARTSDAYGAEVEWSTRPSEISRAYVRLGAQRTEPDLGPSQTSVIAGLGGRWDGQRSRLFLDALRAVSPVSAGVLVERYQLRARVERDMTQRVSLLIGLRASRDQPIEEPSPYPRREYATAEAGFDVRLQPAWSIRAVYNYLWQDYADESTNRSANGVLLSLIYEPRRRP